MGTFNRVLIDGEEYQTKALEIMNLVLDRASDLDFIDNDDFLIQTGDEVVLSRKAQSVEEYDMAPEHYYEPQPANYSVEILRERDGLKMFVQVRDNKITQTFEKDDVLCFDYLGNSIGSQQVSPILKENPLWIKIRNILEEEPS